MAKRYPLLIPDLVETYLEKKAYGMSKQAVLIGLLLAGMREATEEDILRGAILHARTRKKQNGKNTN